MNYVKYVRHAADLNEAASSSLPVQDSFPFTQARMGVCGLLWSRRHMAWFLTCDWSKARVWEDGGKTSLVGLVLKIRTKLQSASIRASV